MIFSDYLDSSELNRLNATSGQNRYVPISAAMLDILKYSLEAAQESEGSYDISMGPVVKLWRKARAEQKLPDADSLQIALQKVGYKFIHLDTVHQAVWLEKPGMQLDLGGLGKGSCGASRLENNPGCRVSFSYGKCRRKNSNRGCTSGKEWLADRHYSSGRKRRNNAPVIIAEKYIGSYFRRCLPAFGYQRKKVFTHH